MELKQELNSEIGFHGGVLIVPDGIETEKNGGRHFLYKVLIVPDGIETTFPSKR